MAMAITSSSNIATSERFIRYLRCLLFFGLVSTAVLILPNNSNASPSAHPSTDSLQKEELAKDSAKHDNLKKSRNMAHAFGIALYAFQQGDHFKALIEISAAKHRNQNGLLSTNDSLQAMETLEAGIMLAYGMQHHAHEVIQSTTSKTLAGPQQSLAWFYLAQLYASKQNWSQAYLAIQPVGKNLPSRLTIKFNQLKANVYINTGRTTEALQLLKQNNDPVLAAYTSFNLATAERNKQNNSTAYAHLAHIEKSENSQLEIRLLKDRAHLASAQIAASEQQYKKAFSHFNRIKIDSPYSVEALFGQGWAAYYLENYDRALFSWELLQQNYSLYPQAQKSRLAIPYIYLAKGDNNTALNKYHDAVRIFEAITAQLNTAQSNLSDGHLFEFMSMFSETTGSYSNFKSVEFPVTTETVLIGEFLKEKNIHLDLTSLAELYQLKYAINTRQHDLTSFGHLIETSDRNHAEKIPLITAETKKLAQLKLLDKAQQLNERLRSIRSTDNFYALMNDKEIDYSTRITRGNNTLLSILDEDKRKRYQARIKRVEGALLWNLSESYPSRIWQAEKGIKAINASIQSSASTQQRLTDSIQQHAQKSGPITEKVASFKDRLEQTSKSTEYLIHQQEAHIEQQYLAAIKQKKEQIRGYLVHSYLAIARLTDKVIEPKLAIQNE